MNDRIVEHALDAIVKYPAAEAWVFTDEELEKFAGLIVRDCLNIMESTSYLDVAISEVKERFGVEE